MKSTSFDQAVDKIVSRNRCYDAEAYYFVRDALDFSLERLIRQEGGMGRHLKGQELLKGVVDYALKEYGPLAWTVLSSWNIKKDIDVGHVVYNLIDEEVFSKSDSDSFHDFDQSMNMKELLEAPFKPNPSSEK